MFEKLLISKMAGALAAHSAARQSVVAQNVANADTPGYKARDVANFARLVDDAGAGPMQATRAGHISGSSMAQLAEPFSREGAEPSPNGNTVSLEDEMVVGAEVRQAHDMAISIYTSAGAMMRAALGRT